MNAPENETSLTDDQRRYVQTIFDYFHTEARWPTYAWLQRKLVRDIVGPIYKVAESLPPWLTNASEARLRDREATLTVPALIYCTGADEELAAFLRVLQFCLEQYFSDQESPHISREDLLCSLHMDERTIQQMDLLLQGEPHIRGSGHGGAEWGYELADEIQDYCGVQTLDDYLARRPRPTLGHGGPSATLEEYLDSQAIGGQVVGPDLSSLIADEELRRRCTDLLTADASYDRAIREACVILEDRVRRASGAASGTLGTSLMELAFGPRQGPLRLGATDQEQLGAMQLYRGVMAFVRNRAGHNVVDAYTQRDAVRIVAFIDWLLALVEQTASSQTSSP